MSFPSSWLLFWLSQEKKNKILVALHTYKSLFLCWHNYDSQCFIMMHQDARCKSFLTVQNWNRLEKKEKRNSIIFVDVSVFELKQVFLENVFFKLRSRLHLWCHNYQQPTSCDCANKDGWNQLSCVTYVSVWKGLQSTFWPWGWPCIYWHKLRNRN